MRRSAFLAGLGLALTVPGAAKADAARVRIAALGDSLALGTGASRADGGFLFRAFRTVLATRPGSSIDDVAIGGATIATVLRLELPRLVGTRYDVAIICVGANDAIRRTPGEDFHFNYGLLLQGVAHAARHARVICCGVPDVSLSPLFSDERDAIRGAAEADNRAVRQLAAASGAAFVDLFALSHARRDPARYLSGDRFHPSDAGYELFAQALVPILERSLAQRNLRAV